MQISVTVVYSSTLLAIWDGIGMSTFQEKHYVTLQMTQCYSSLAGVRTTLVKALLVATCPEMDQCMPPSSSRLLWMLGDVVVVFESSPCSWLDLWAVILSRAACLSDIVGYWKGVVDSQTAQDCLFCCTLEYTGMLALPECPSHVPPSSSITRSVLFGK